MVTHAIEFLFKFRMPLGQKRDNMDRLYFLNEVCHRVIGDGIWFDLKHVIDLAVQAVEVMPVPIVFEGWVLEMIVVSLVFNKVPRRVWKGGFENRDVFRRFISANDLSFQGLHLLVQL